MVVGINGIYSLNNSEGEKEDGGNNRENGPRVPEVGMNEICTPFIPLLLAVLIDLLVHSIQAAFGVERHILGEGVKEFGNGFVTSNGILDDTFGVEEANIPGIVNDAVHEEDI